MASKNLLLLGATLLGLTSVRTSAQTVDMDKYNQAYATWFSAWMSCQRAAAALLSSPDQPIAKAYAAAQACNASMPGPDWRNFLIHPSGGSLGPKPPQLVNTPSTSVLGPNGQPLPQVLAARERAQLNAMAEERRRLAQLNQLQGVRRIGIQLTAIGDAARIAPALDEAADRQRALDAAAKGEDDAAIDANSRSVEGFIGNDVAAEAAADEASKAEVLDRALSQTCTDIDGLIDVENKLLWTLAYKGVGGWGKAASEAVTAGLTAGDEGIIEVPGAAAEYHWDQVLQDLTSLSLSITALRGAQSPEDTRHEGKDALLTTLEVAAKADAQTLKGLGHPSAALVPVALAEGLPIVRSFYEFGVGWADVLRAEAVGARMEQLQSMKNGLEAQLSELRSRGGH